jgi:uncharacterized membrane protein
MRKQLQSAGRKIQKALVWGEFSIFLVGISAVAEISFTLGSFFPLKAVFIAAGSSIPSFFPVFLRSGSPLAAMIWLLAFALACLGFGVLGRIVSARLLNKRQAAYKGNWSGRAGVGRHPKKLEMQEKIFLHAILIIFFGGIAAYVNIYMASMVFVLLCAIALGSALYMSYRTIPSRFDSKIGEFHHLFDTAVRKTVLWTAVLSAVFATQILNPLGGITGLLIAIIFLRRAQVELLGVTGTIVDYHLQNLIDSQHYANLAPEGGRKPHLHPVLIGSLDRQTRLAAVLSKWTGDTQHGLRLVGNPTRNSAGYLVINKHNQIWFVRFFNPRPKDEFESEIVFRSRVEQFLGSRATEGERFIFDKHPAYISRVPDGKWVGAPQLSVASARAMEWQLNAELSTQASGHFQSYFSHLSDSTRIPLFIKNLKLFSTVSGPQAEHAGALAGHSDLMAWIWNIDPNCISFNRRFVDRRNLVPIPGVESVFVVNPFGWQLAPLGASWGSIAKFERLLEETGASSELVERAEIRRLISVCEGHLTAGHVLEFEPVAKKLLFSLAKL